MLLKNFDVVLVTAFRQSLGLVAELARQKKKVLVVDLSSKLGVWPAEDVEGPFGLFRTETLKPNYLDALFSEEGFHEVENGFTLWLDSGPLEFKGPLTKYHLKKRNLDPQLFDSAQVQEVAQKNNFRFQTLQSPETLDFESQWILPLAHQLGSTTFKSSRQSLNSGSSFPITASFFVRWTSRSGNEKSFAWLRAQGVTVTDQTDIIDISYDGGKRIHGLELKGELSGLYRCDSLVWGLTSEETYFYNSVLGQEIYPQGPLESEWSWVRYRVKIKPHPQTRLWPLHFCFLKDKDSPWTHENLVLWQKTSLEEFLDAWIRIPTVQRFNKNYLFPLGQKIVNSLSARVHGVDPEIHHQPQEYSYTYHQVGPPRFPIFNVGADSRRNKKSSFKNLFFDGAERWQIYSHEARQKRQEEILKALRHWHDELERKRRKEVTL